MLGVAQSMEEGATRSKLAACGEFCRPQQDGVYIAADSLVYKTEPSRPELLETSTPSAATTDPFAAPALGAQPISALSGPRNPIETREFLRQAAMSATLEARAGDIVATWSPDPALRAEAARAQAAAQEDLAQLRALADGLNATVSLQAFDALHAAQVTKLRHADGAHLGLAYQDLRGDNAAKLLAYAQMYAEAGEDEALRTYAQRRADALSGRLAMERRPVTTG